MRNPNRFITGLSDISDIVDIPCNEGSQVIPQNPSVPIVVPSPPKPEGTASLVQFEQVLSADGAQTLSVGEPIGSSSMLFVNGFIQSKSEYNTNGAFLVLASSLNLHAGDTVILVYLK